MTRWLATMPVVGQGTQGAPISVLNEPQGLHRGAQIASDLAVTIFDRSGPEARSAGAIGPRTNIPQRPVETVEKALALSLRRRQPKPQV